MASINPYIHFNGNAEEAFTFYKSVFSGDFATVVRFKDMSFEGSPGADKESEEIMHIALPIGKHSVLMGSKRTKISEPLFLCVKKRQILRRIVGFKGPQASN